MRHFSALSDRTAHAHNFDNIHRFAARPQKAQADYAAPPQIDAHLAIPPSYSATIGRLVVSPQSPSAPTMYVHNPYGVSVLTEPIYPREVAPVPPSTPSSLDVSRDSTGSSSSACHSIVVKTPIRRVYRNGRPVPIFTENASCQGIDEVL
jgi:hypothetical protein